MKKLHLPAIGALLLWTATLCAFTACDDDTATIGTSIMPDFDNVSTSQAVYTVHTKAVKVDSVLANTSDCYLGRIVDPETRAQTTCNFLAQFHVLENYAFPELEEIIRDDNGDPIADSCVLRVFFDRYYGDSLTTMTLHVQELDTAKVMEENVPYYTNLDAADYLSATTPIRTDVSYTVKDLSRPDSVTDGSTYLRSVVIKLPAAYGQHLLKKYYENPANYQDSYQFIHHVCPGFYFQTTGGTGVMINAEVTTLDVYFRYKSKTSLQRDTIVTGMQRMAATEEVIQNTQVSNSVPGHMLDENNAYTYVKSPTGIFTEVILPVDEIVAGEHYTDTINSARLSIRRYNNTVESPYNLDPPQTLLMVRKSEATKFFENEQLSDERTSFLSDFVASNNAYTFDNISSLITLIKNERDAGAGCSTDEDEATRAAKYAAWEAEHPDWNKVWLIPVKAEYSTTTNIYGQTTRTLLRIRHDMSLASARLEGGTSDDLEINIIYSRFNQ